nr:hypothetical protein CFP56_10294 [Quercus suber]
MKYCTRHRAADDWLVRHDLANQTRLLSRRHLVHAVLGSVANQLPSIPESEEWITVRLRGQWPPVISKSRLELMQARTSFGSKVVSSFEVRLPCRRPKTILISPTDCRHSRIL